MGLAETTSIEEPFPRKLSRDERREWAARRIALEKGEGVRGREEVVEEEGVREEGNLISRREAEGVTN